MEATIPGASVEAGDCTQLSRRRNLLTASEASLAFTVTVSGTAALTATANSITSVVNDAVNSGDFTDALEAAADDLGVDDFTALTVTGTSVNIAPTAAPTPSPTTPAPTPAPTTPAPTMTATTPSPTTPAPPPAPPPIILIIVAIAVLVIVIVVACAAFKLGRATAKVNPLPDSQVVPVRPTQVAQMPACVELVPIGVVKTSVLVTQQDNNGNNIVHEQAVAADHALGQATLPQGVILRRS